MLSRNSTQIRFGAWLAESWPVQRFISTETAKLRTRTMLAGSSNFVNRYPSH